MLKTLTIFDIDGVLIPDIAEYIITGNYTKIKNIIPHQNIINMVNIAKKNSDILFLTGRSNNDTKLKKITIKMLDSIISNYEVIFSPYNLDNWTMKTYIEYKLKHCINKAIEYDIIIFIDDNYELIEYVKTNFRLKNKKLMCIYAKYNPNINNVQCIEIL